jgi:DNA-directed RNA polymerase subunit beta
MHYFYPIETIHVDPKGMSKNVNHEVLPYQRSSADIIDPGSKEVLVKKGRRFVRNIIEKLKRANVERIPIDPSELADKFAADDIVDKKTGEVIVNFNELITEPKLDQIKSADVKEFRIFYIDNVSVVASLRSTILADKIKTREDSITEIYKKFRPTDPPTLSVAESFFDNMFFNPDTYRLSQVGRLKINYKLNHGIPDEVSTLTREDIMETVRYLLALRGGRGTTDDIDHLGNRRVRTVGELIEDRFYHGLERLARSVKEKMGYQAVENLMPSDAHTKTVIAVVKEFFATGQLSQFMDQTNPLSEITHKRRLSALGPGGLTRERAGFEVRDVHSSHYGRICPIETPEGPNIGLISSLSTYGKINEFGFIQTPYRVVKGARVTDEIVYMHARAERNTHAQANAPSTRTAISHRNLFRPGTARFSWSSARRWEWTFPSAVSVSASLIPFSSMTTRTGPLRIEHEPCPSRTSAPRVGTGFESTVAKDSGVTVIAKRDGIVEYVDSSRVVVSSTGDVSESEAGVDMYGLLKFQKSNQSTCWNQKPIVSKGQGIKAGQVIADGPSRISSWHSTERSWHSCPGVIWTLSL